MLYIPIILPAGILTRVTQFPEINLRRISKKSGESLWRICCIKKALNMALNQTGCWAE